MARSTVTHAGVGYLVADEDPRLPESLWWAVLRCRVIDELTAEPPQAALTVITTTRHCTPRIGDDGICGLVARPTQISHSMLLPGGLSAEVRVEGYLPRSLTPAIEAARRRIAAPAAIGDRTVMVAPDDPSPRRQFLPGRGVLLERQLPSARDEFTLVDQRTGPVAADQVPLENPVRSGRPMRAPPLPPRAAVGVPIVLPDQALHRARPAVVRGRALRQTAPGGPILPALPAQTQIGITGVWWRYPEIPANSNPTHSPDFVSFGSPLIYMHEVSAPIERCTLTFDGTLRTLAAGAAAGTNHLLVQPSGGLNPAGGDVLRIERDNSPERELAITQGFTLPAGPNEPVLVPLRTPLAFPHLSRIEVASNNLMAVALTTVDREALPGDRVLFGGSLLAALPAESILRIDGGTPNEEMRLARRPPIHSGGTYTNPINIQADGSFELPPLGRVAQLRIQAQHTGQAALQPIDFIPDYAGENTLQILFTP